MPRIGRVSECSQSDQFHVGEVTKPNQKFVFEWEIVDFFSYAQADAVYLSSDFKILNSKCYFVIYPNYNFNIHNKSFNLMALCLTIVDSSKFKPSDVKFAAKTSQGNYEHMITKECFTKEIGNPLRHWCTFEENKNLLVHEGILTVACIVNFKIQNFDSRPNKLIEDLKHFYNLKKHSDVIFKINEATISAHKAILAARSSVFDAMFENDMEEKKTGVVTITDCDLIPFNVFLQYIYTGEAEFSKCDVFQLCRIADKYCVHELMQMCVDFILCNLSVDTVFEAFVSGKQLNESKLLADSQSFFCKNFKQIVCSDTWKSFMVENRDLANDLLQALADKLPVKQD